MFLLRLALLLVLMVLYAAYDYWKHKQAATRWKEYSFLVSCALLAAVIGVINDSITVRISPAYFIHGKGLAADDGLVFAAQCLGAQAGVVAGFICAGILLVATGTMLTYRQAYRCIALICLGGVGAALLGAVLVPPIMQSSDILHALDLNDAEQIAFYQVWGVHLGLYAGALLALLLIVVAVRWRQHLQHVAASDTAAT